MNRILFLTLLIALTAACVPQRLGPKIDFNNSTEIGKLIELEYDEFKKTTSYVAPEGNVEPTRTFRNTAYLRATKLNSNIIVLQILIHDIYDGEWRYYNNVYDNDGKRLDVTLIDQDVLNCTGGICSFSEVVGVNISLDYLESHIDKGIRLKLSGKSGSQVFQLSPAYVEAFVLKLTDR